MRYSVDPKAPITVVLHRPSQAVSAHPYVKGGYSSDDDRTVTRRTGRHAPEPAEDGAALLRVSYSLASASSAWASPR